MPDLIPTESQIGTAVPFPPEVDVKYFEKFKAIEHEITNTKKVFTAPDDKPGIAQVIEDIIQREDTPNEAKIEAFRQAYELIADPDERQVNKEVARTLIDIIRAQRDPSIRIRLAAIVSHDLQDDFFQPTTKRQKLYDPLREKGKQTRAHWVARNERKDVFEELAGYQTDDTKDQNTTDPLQKKYQAWARSLLKPGSTLKIFNTLYDWDSKVDMTPRIIEEITEETSGNESDSTEETISLAGLVRLQPPYLPSWEKMVAYEEANGRPLPFFLVWKEGAYFISIEFPLEFTKESCDDWLRFRAGEITREEVFERATDRVHAFIEKMTPEQRAEIEEVGKTKNVHIRFSTKREGSESSQQLQPVEQPEQKAA